MTWKERSRLPIGNEVGMIELEPGRILVMQRDIARTNSYAYLSDDHGRTWAEPESMRRTLGILQRAVLHRVREGHDTILLFGRDATRKQMVAFISRDNGKTFGERQVIDVYARDGAYGTAQSIGASVVSLAWYTDIESPSGHPNIMGAKIGVHEPRWLWVNLDSTGPQESHFHVYTGNSDAEPLEFFAGTVGRPAIFIESEMGPAEGRP